MTRIFKGLSVGLLLSLGLFASQASAYPTSVIFAPTGEAKPGGDLNLLLYTSINYSPKLQLQNGSSERFSPGATWTGFAVGVLPQFTYSGDYKFGGLEISSDLFWPESSGQGKIKPVFGAKLQLLTEAQWSPALALGIMDVSTMSRQSLNLGYISATRTLKLGETSYGRVTAGLAKSFAPASQRYPQSCSAEGTSGDPCMFRGTSPLADNESLALMAGYESPSFGPFYIAVDHLGGTTEVSSTNIALNIEFTPGTYFAVGGFWGNERRTSVLKESNPGGDPYDGVFFYLSSTASVPKLFSPKPAEGSEEK